MNLAPPLLAAEHLGFYWHLPILIVVVCLVYGATRHDRWDRILHEAGRWMLRMALFLVGIMLVLSGLALDGSPVVVRVAIATIGLALEASLLFIK